ncbi:MAG TPA: hypothetical protein VM076_09505 [Gemmatimonadaceae bacterium]|nr:hypothetical protein [Gemmatimonadaceae bacterium]
MMVHPRFLQLVIGARRQSTTSPRATGRRQVGSQLTQFSFRLAFAIDLAYVGIGAVGGAAVTHASGGSARMAAAVPACAPTPSGVIR